MLKSIAIGLSWFLKQVTSTKQQVVQLSTWQIAIFLMLPYVLKLFFTRWSKKYLPSNTSL